MFKWIDNVSNRQLVLFVLFVVVLVTVSGAAISSNASQEASDVSHEAAERSQKYATYFANVLYANQLAACLRGNDLRKADADKAKVLEEFINSAAEIRRRQAKESTGKMRELNLVAAATYEQLIKRIVVEEPINCTEAVHKVDISKLEE